MSCPHLLGQEREGRGQARAGLGETERASKEKRTFLAPDLRALAGSCWLALTVLGRRGKDHVSFGQSRDCRTPGMFPAVTVPRHRVGEQPTRVTPLIPAPREGREAGGAGNARTLLRNKRETLQLGK